VTGSRAAATTYYNTTGKPITVNITTNLASVNDITLSVAGINVGRFGANTTNNNAGGLLAIVPPSNSYLLTLAAGTIATWAELR
jgi:hypothetical protein